jgi:hypothetical protein
VEIDTDEESRVDGQKTEERKSGIYNCSRQKLDGSPGLAVTVRNKVALDLSTSQRPGDWGDGPFSVANGLYCTPC